MSCLSDTPSKGVGQKVRIPKKLEAGDVPLERKMREHGRGSGIPVMIHGGPSFISHKAFAQISVRHLHRGIGSHQSYFKEQQHPRDNRPELVRLEFQIV